MDNFNRTDFESSRAILKSVQALPVLRTIRRLHRMATARKSSRASKEKSNSGEAKAPEPNSSQTETVENKTTGTSVTTSIDVSGGYLTNAGDKYAELGGNQTTQLSEHAGEDYKKFAPELTPEKLGQGQTIDPVTASKAIAEAQGRERVGLVKLANSRADNAHLKNMLQETKNQGVVLQIAGQTAKNVRLLNEAKYQAGMIKPHADTRIAQLRIAQNKARTTVANANNSEIQANLLLGTSDSTVIDLEVE